MTKYFRYLLITGFIFIFTQLYPQTPSYYHYTSSDGLASSTVFDILQTSDGYLWFGTLNGVSKFDGKHFTTFNINDGLNSNVITSLLEGENGEIYLGNYEKGINIYQDGKFKNYRSKINGRIFNTTYLLKQQKKIITYSNLTILIMNEESKNDQQDSTIDIFKYHLPNPTFMHRVAKLANNKLVILTSNGLFGINNHVPVKINVAGMLEKDLYSLAELSDGTYFIGAKGCLYHVKNNRVIKKFTMDGYNDKLFYYVFCDRNNNIWFSILGKGFFLIPNNSDEIINLGKKMGLENTSIDCFFEDSEGNIWIGTYGKGVYCLNNLYLKNYTEADGLNNNNIICIAKDKSGKLLIGTINGISILENGTIVRVKDNSGKTLSGYINSIKCYDDYTYVCWAPETPEVKNISYNGLKIRTVPSPSFNKTASGYYIFGTIGNSISIQKEFNYNKRNKFIYLPIFGDSIFHNRVNAVIEDSRKNIWVGTSLGLCKLSRLSGKPLETGWNKTFFAGNRVLSSKINSIYEDNKNNIWFTGANGLARYNLVNDSVYTYTSLLKHELSTPTSIVCDSRNRYWIGTMKGLYLLDDGSIKFLNSKTGLPSDEVLSLYFDEDKNILYIGTSDGLSLLNINLFDEYKQPPVNVMINRIQAGDSVFTNYNNLVFEPSQNYVSVNYRVINYSSPGVITYRYILNGDSRETKNDFLDFSSLENGIYNLQIMAKTQNTDWGKPYSLSFRVLPRFVETMWFDFLLVSIILFAAVLILIWRLKLNKKKIGKQLELTERINDLKHQALSAMMNPHFIFNSLNSVQYLINCNRNEEANDYIAMMAKLIRKNLDTAGSGFILLSEEIYRLKLYLNLEKLRFQDNFTYEILIEPDVIADSTMIPNMIIQPFVENTLWHGIINSGSKGMVTVSFSFEDVDMDTIIYRSLIIKVTDNGIGINEARKNKKEDHISKGIQIIEERLRLLSTKMELPKPIMFEDLSSRENNSRGTEVIISLPPPLYKIIIPE